jgi:hypothetical protein
MPRGSVLGACCRVVSGTTWPAPTARVSGQLAPVLSALTAAKNPHGVLWWLQHSPNARLLAEVAASGESLSHDLLDDLPPSPIEYYVRQILVLSRPAFSGQGIAAISRGFLPVKVLVQNFLRCPVPKR